MTEKWELGGIDCDEIEANSSLTLDGGFDFNSIWNSDFRNHSWPYPPVLQASALHQTVYAPHSPTPETGKWLPFLP